MTEHEKRIDEAFRQYLGTHNGVLNMPERGECGAFKAGYEAGRQSAIAEVVPTHAEINQEAREQFLGYEGAIFTSVNLVEAFRVGAKWVLAKLSAEGEKS